MYHIHISEKLLVQQGFAEWKAASRDYILHGVHVISKFYFQWAKFEVKFMHLSRRNNLKSCLINKTGLKLFIAWIRWGISFSSILIDPFLFRFYLKKCLPVTGLGFRAGSYKCVCRPGYYFPNVTSHAKYFNGSEIEAAAVEPSHRYYSNPDSFQCIKCQPGCDACVDGSPCIVTLNWPLRRALMGLTVVTILAAIGISAFILYFRELKVSFLISSELEIPHPSPIRTFLQSYSYGPLQRENFSAGCRIYHCRLG